MITSLDLSSVFHVRPFSGRAYSSPFSSCFVCCSTGNSSTVVVPSAVSGLESPDRNAVRLGLPSKGRMADETLNLLKVNGVLLGYLFLCFWLISLLCSLFSDFFFFYQNCQLSVRQLNPRQYVADIPQVFLFCCCHFLVT